MLPPGPYSIALEWRVKRSVHEARRKDVKPISHDQGRNGGIARGNECRARVQRNRREERIPVIGNRIADQRGEGQDTIEVERCDQDLRLR